MCQSVECKVLEYIRIRQRGKIYFSVDFATLGNAESIRKSLSALTKRNEIIRLTQGIYLYPKIDKEFGVLYPSVDDVCRAIAKRDKARIEPTGVFALHSLGLSTQIPVNVVYLTDGIPRKIRYGTRIIKFKKTSPKNLVMKGRISGLVIAALKQLGKENITQYVETQLIKALRKESYANIQHDVLLAPVWISKLILNLAKYVDDELDKSARIKTS